MRLRNKKTGEIWFVSEILIDPYGIEAALYKDDASPFDKKYDSLTELNEEWEDYTPKEPLIKDEKICKAVRAWAGCNLLDDNDKVFLSKPTFDCKILSLEHGMLNFDVYYDDESLCNKHYTIAELCGESNDD